ncbi:MAG: NADH-quinone oxidoreductase subunit J [Bacteroidota bacterium]
MNAIAIITYLFAIVAAISAVTILFVKEVFHAAILLIICLLCVAGIFIAFNSEFLAVVQLIVYAGGVLLLIIFGIMLTVRDNQQLLSNNKILSALIGFALFSVMVYSLTELSLPADAGNPPIEPEKIGVLLMTQYAIPFELSGVLLLVSLIGAIMVSTNKTQS